MRFLLICSAGNTLHEFRLPELESIATLYNFKIEFEQAQPDVARPYMIVNLPSEREARLLGSRVVAVKAIYEYWTDAASYDELHDNVRGIREVWSPYATSRETTWKFKMGAHGRTIPMAMQREIINTFSYMEFVGDINLKDPMVEIGVFEEYIAGEAKAVRGRDASDMRRVWMGKKICDTQRHMMDVFDLKKRAYIGNTSMDAEVSLLMANQALAAPGKLIYDPFAGTGSMLLTGSAFGALSFGSDIDGRQMRGKKTNIRDSAKQYGIGNRIVDCCSFDLTQHPFRTGELFDAIVTDPPYGVRAGAKRLGRKPDARAVPPTLVPGREDEGYHHQMPGYVPPSVPWEMTEVIDTLITYSIYLLKPGGRLVYFLPTNNEEYRDVDVPIVPGLKLISNSSQDFGKWARRLITMEKVVDGGSDAVIAELDRGIAREGVEGRLEKLSLRAEGDEERRPGHASFAKRYFEGFKAGESVA